MNELHCNTYLVYDLHHGAATGNVGLIKFALDHDAPIDCVVNGLMPLQVACISDNNLAAVQYLIDRGAEINAQRWHKKDAMDKSQPTGSTALHVACANGCIRIVDLLLRNSASIFLKDKYGSTPLDVANAKGSHVDIVRRLLEMTAGPRPTYSRVDKPLPIPIQAKLQNSSRHPQHQQQPSSNLPDLSSSHPSHKSSISSSDSCWYGVGTTGRYEEGDQYIKALERRLNASLDDAYPWSHHRLDTDTTSSRHTSSNCDQNYDCNYYDKQSLLSHPTPYALQMSLDSLNKASRNSLDVLSKKPDYDMVPLPTVPATPAIATAATSHRIGSLKPKALKKFLLWSWRKTGSFAVG